MSSLASTLTGFSSREEVLLNPLPTSDVMLGGPVASVGRKVGEDETA